ncbi:N-acetylmuramoyl-L-alanine amidase [Perognathus longimembris pacificus]|uniref:N-acetylmuramoyl-L-alanine amidase n=1 Tax=Perognathus longimembris pacificus TaxID=214514 RepID=UPI002018EBA8|nr:N-acetylmuramoyl-L-alanine amidase [Perognathus longimembris pacificus]
MAQGGLWILLTLLLWPQLEADSLPLLMDSVIQAVAELEQKVWEVEAGQATPAGVLLIPTHPSSPNPLHHALLESLSLSGARLDPDPLSTELRALMDQVTQHHIRGGQEHGVVLAPDGSTVAVRPLLLGLEAGQQGRRAVPLPLGDSLIPHGDTGGNTLAGFRNDSVNFTSVGDKAEPPTMVDSLLAVTLAAELGLAFLHPRQTPSQPGLATEGCWDQLSAPQTFTLLDSQSSPLTMAFLNGALDGALLGDHLSRLPQPRSPLSHLLREYYGAGVDGHLAFRSNFRRQNGAALMSAASLAQQVWGALILLQRLEPRHSQLHNRSQEELAHVASSASEEFTEAFLGCPAIHPRCRWGAAPYRGSPTLLQLPLSFLFVHHTFEPAQPCTSFARCAASLRDVQRFHQDVRHWDDIGYSFVVGSDGYVYEGRGWHWVGAHTRGHNSRGFGVAFIGNYTATLPTEAELRTVRDRLPKCALRTGLLRPDYKLLGHRQLRRGTDCPGDALFGLLRTWPHFTQTENYQLPRESVRDPGRHYRG